MDKQTLGLAAEFAVASELCRRGIYAQLTLGLRKRTDILVETEKRMLKIQVKGKKGKHWPAVKGIFEKDMFLVFVDYENKPTNERPDFYILDSEDWKNLAENIFKNHNYPKHIISLSECYEICYSKIGETKPFWFGTDIKLNHIKDFKELWGKIESVTAI